MMPVTSFSMLALFAGQLAATGVFAESGEYYSHGDPTAHEQLMLEWVNAARANPTAEAQRLGVGLNDGLAAGTITTTPKQPLAFNAKMIAAARGHSAWMLATNTFSHVGANGSRGIDRLKAAGYAFLSPYTWCENVSWRGNTAPIDVTTYTRMNYEGLMRSSYHRLNMLYEHVDEAGFGVLQGKFVSGYSFNVNMVTQNFALSAGSPDLDARFLTGVVYRDLDKNGAYSVGEGIPGVMITTSVGSHHTVTSASGGYAVPVAGASESTLLVTMQGGGVPTSQRSVSWTGLRNVKVDFVLGVETTVAEVLADTDNDGIADAKDLFDASAPFPPVQVNTRWEWKAPQSLAGATWFEAAGLPPGLRLYPANGVISGMPSRPGTYTFKVRARHGTVWGAWQTVTLEVRAWSAQTTGNYVALVARESTLNQSLGGLLQVSTTSLGQLTGSIRLGGRVYHFRSLLTGAPGENPTASIGISRPWLPPLVISLAWDGANGLTGSLGDGTNSASLAGWKKTWDSRMNPAPAHLHGQFNSVLPLVSNEADARPVPQGAGWAILRLDAAGVATFFGKTSEGARFTSALPVGPHGEIPLWTMPDRSPSSLIGQAEISGENLDGSLGWVKLPQPGRYWSQGFGTAAQPVKLSLKGARYTPPASGTAQTAWGLGATYPNAIVMADDALAFPFAVNPYGAVGVARPGTSTNLNFARIGINLRDGVISGAWVLSDIDPNYPTRTLKRTAIFEAILIPRSDVAEGGFARGFHLVPSLPQVGQLVNGTPMVSGSTVLKPKSL